MEGDEVDASGVAVEVQEVGGAASAPGAAMQGLAGGIGELHGKGIGGGGGAQQLPLLVAGQGQHAHTGGSDFGKAGAHLHIKADVLPGGGGGGAGGRVQGEAVELAAGVVGAQGAEVGGAGAGEPDVQDEGLAGIVREGRLQRYAEPVALGAGRDGVGGRHEHGVEVGEEGVAGKGTRCGHAQAYHQPGEGVAQVLARAAIAEVQRGDEAAHLVLQVARQVEALGVRREAGVAQQEGAVAGAAAALHVLCAERCGQCNRQREEGGAGVHGRVGPVIQTY